MALTIGTEHAAASLPRLRRDISSPRKNKLPMKPSLAVCFFIGNLSTSTI